MFVWFSNILWVCLNGPSSSSSSSREMTVVRKTSVPSAPTGPTTSGPDNGDAWTPPWISSDCPPTRLMCRHAMTTMISAPSTAAAALRAKATKNTKRDCESRLMAPPSPPQAPQMTWRTAGARPAARPRTRPRPWILLSVDPPPPVEDPPV